MFALFDVTKRCNLTCKYCGNDSNLGFEDKLDFEEITTALRKMKDNGVGVVSFSGGEVFMRDDFMDV
ncbi:MAG: radical SAM protein, partial [Candidatus Aenigmatarchaeota archaeon]